MVVDKIIITTVETKEKQCFVKIFALVLAFSIFYLCVQCC